MDTSQWSQEFGLGKPMEEMVSSSATTSNHNSSSSSTMEQQQRRAPRPQKEQCLLHCPRCNSTNTKFCYYNNYSLTQPRYFCKACRRYWTEGGSLRNVPVGGGSRKNRTSTSTSATTSAATSTQKPKLVHEGQDLNLAFPFPELTPSADHMELFRSTSGRPGLSPFIPMHSMPMPMEPEYCAPGFEILLQQDYKPSSLSFTLDGRLPFPFEDSRHEQVTSTTTTTSSDEQQNNRGQGGGGGDAPGFWSGMIGGGGQQ